MTTPTCSSDDSDLRIIKLSHGELRHPWILTDDSNVIDKRAGRWTNGGHGFRTRRDAAEVRDEILAERGEQAGCTFRSR